MRHIVEHNPETVALLIECWEARNPVRETAKICGISEKGFTVGISGTDTRVQTTSAR